MDEAVADVYGILNMGPVFPINVAGIHWGAARERRARVGAACRGRPARCFHRCPPNDPKTATIEWTSIPSISCGFISRSGSIERHEGAQPRPRATTMSRASKRWPRRRLPARAFASKGLSSISHDDWIPIKTSMPLPVAAKAARRVGKMIATRKLKALNNHSIQDIETWDDADEETAQAIANQILKNRSVVGTRRRCAVARRGDAGAAQTPRAL